VIKALDNISLHLQDGDRVGILGHNGAGKSTFLRVLANIYEPTRGRMVVQGKVSPLLDVMLGIDPESTGYENILLRGLLLGLKRKEILKKMDEIAEFTELGDFLSVPIRTYSSGMMMRLAFAVATSIQPDILVMDEIIGVGDDAFLTRARERLDHLIEQSNIVVLASHSDEIIRKMCNKAIVLDGGRLKQIGPIETVLGEKTKPLEVSI
jgi:ABC-type polysaccharide/polyol phosphate transport system ATPase subunit